ncbi:acyltransferase ChoActase/COT/CPT [Hyphopichia burtonii NRRL Y-1933]|uniref:Carnitine O-acetyltransferase, mitochondrial n=1 Tax=Hyphopichia burtonii NRRL Y-1933 TaxID=984485 RepID=A0A1E4RG79_9ASCO|nr:acyltransferase ChoActase/COT/CPT [Hyphopichia burtonii NRRL Y-1933]ODV66270.1 acyltransferase ChoActase/COT/CPT [Hyphopichia burtonii NRRL Y-1933]
MIKTLRFNKMSINKQFSTSALKGDLYKYQSKLPKLPVPTLQETSEKYLKTIEPYLSQEQLKKSKSLVADFVKSGGVGEVLQNRLIEFAKDKDNWLAEWWDDYAYLSYRDPVVPYVSYFFNHKDINTKIGKDQLLKSSLIAYYTTKFLIEVENETLEPEIIKGNPYCLNAFRYMFNNSRVPHEGSDLTKMYNGKDHRYFIAIFKNNFYKVYHHDSNDELLSKTDIYNQLLAITLDNQPKGEGLGALTSLNRDEWLKSYNSLVKSPINEASLESIFASSFVICLDDNTPITIEEKSKNNWHGDGQNRFFDKPLEYFVSANGNSGFLGEHSKMDATPTVQLNNYVLQEISKEDSNQFINDVNSNLKKLTPESLKFDINPVVRQDIKDAIEKFDQTIASHDEEVFQYYGYGKNLIKQFKVSPDAYVQMLIQLAYYKMTGKVRPTYESAATRKYLKGRTETGRSVSNESKKFVETWTSFESSNEDKIATFQNACKQHVKYLVEAADGKGVDRHFFGLQQMLQPGEDIPAVFKDPVHKYSSTWYISSSQVPSEYFQSWGWSQVIDEGFGLAYLVNNDWLHVHISCKKGNGLRSDYLKYYLTEAANELRDVLKTTLPSKAKL